MSIHSLLVQKCDVYQRDTTIGVFGDACDTYILLYSQIPCRSIHKNTSFGSFSGQVNSINRHTLYVDNDYILDTTMRVSIDGTMFNLTHADAKYGGKTKHHSIYEMDVLEHPSTGA